MTAYYNEIDPYAAQWLRNLIEAGHIAPGYVDERSIEDVYPSDLRGFVQCHFFAGIGAWSYALRSAGWGDNRPVWTGSCPCQPFSAAGKGIGFSDERHLWPAFYHLIKECRPAAIFGEQVASKDASAWIDLVHADMEAMGYAFGAVPFPAAGVGAPHIRERIYWAGRADNPGRRKQQSMRQRASQHASQHAAGQNGLAGGVADYDGDGCQQGREGSKAMGQGETIGPDRGSCGMGSADRHISGRGSTEAYRPQGESGGEQEPGDHRIVAEGAGSSARTGPTNGFWRDTDWLLCRDGKWRPVEPGYEQMADGSARSLGRVRASAIQEIEGEIHAWSIRHQADAGKALSRIWADLSAQALCDREVGRFSGVQSPPVLLAFLRQLTDQGWEFAASLPSTAASRIVLRVMRFDPSAACTPPRREWAEQLAGQPADDHLREMSSILAHHAAQCWGEACREKTRAASFPLAHSTANRTGQLRAYGNAIVPQAAAQFVIAYMELEGDAAHH